MLEGFQERGLTHFCPLLRFRNQVQTFAVRETASLGIMGAPRVPPLSPSETIELSEHYRGCKNATVGKNGLMGPHDAERRQALGRFNAMIFFRKSRIVRNFFNEKPTPSSCQIKQKFGMQLLFSDYFRNAIRCQINW